MSYPIAHWVFTSYWPADFWATSQPFVKVVPSIPSSNNFNQLEEADELDEAQHDPDLYRTIQHEIGSHNVFTHCGRGLEMMSREGLFLSQSILAVAFPAQDPEVTQMVASPKRLNLDITGDSSLQHIEQQIKVQWWFCSLLDGAKPTPDVAVGISSSALSQEERFTLGQYQATSQLPTSFGVIYFPFLIYNLGGRGEKMVDVERRNLHTASIAVQTVVQFLRAAADESLLGQVNKHIAAFSISHTEEEGVKVHAHFAVVEDDVTVRYYRHVIVGFSRQVLSEKELRKRIQDIVRAIYKAFFSSHLQRIRQALASMKENQAREWEQERERAWEQELERELAREVELGMERDPETIMMEKLGVDYALQLPMLFEDRMRVLEKDIAQMEGVWQDDVDRAARALGHRIESEYW